MGLTIVHKSDLWTRKRDPRIALVLAGGAVTGGAYKLGGLKALDDFLVNRKTTDFDIYVGLSAGAFLAAPLAGGVTPVEMLRSIDGTSEDFTQLSALEFYRLNVSEFVRKPLEFVVDLATYVPGLLYGFISRTPELVSQLKEPLEQCRRQPSLGNMVECVKPLIDAIGSAREFPFPLAYLPSGLFDNSSLERYLRHNIERRGLSNDFRVLHRLRGVELYIVAMNLDTAERVVFGHDEDTSLTISEAVQASTALPGFYKPARIKGVDYVDGGARRYIPERHEYTIEGKPLADQGMLVVLNQVLRTLLHSRLQLGIRQYQDDPNFQGDIILLEPAETDLAFFKMAALDFWASRSAGAHGYLSVTQSIETHYELMRQILQTYGIQMTRRDVREGLERLTRAEPSESPDDILMRDVPKRSLHVA